MVGVPHQGNGRSSYWQSARLGNTIMRLAMPLSSQARTRLQGMVDKFQGC